MTEFEQQQITLLNREVEAKENYYKELIQLEREKLDILRQLCQNNKNS